MLGATLAAGMNRALSIIGSLSASSSAGSTVTSSTRTVRGTGTILFSGLGGSGTPQYSKNGGAFTTITEGATLAVSYNDTLAVRAIGLTANVARTFNVKNNAGAQPFIQAVSLEYVA